MVPYINTAQGVTLFLKGETQDVFSGAPHFEEILAVIKANEPDAEDQIEEILTRDLRRAQNAVTSANDNAITIRHGVVYFKNAPVDNSITERILRMADDGFDVAPLVSFLQNIMANPSYRVVNSLYEFLEHGRMPITSDGHFLAYKAVKANWKDIYSGTIDNSVGQVVEVPRNQVDEDANRTCSHGLHVCSFTYLPHFAHDNGRIVICKINPADVVAIPADYNNTKMRVCKYEVVGEHADYYQTKSNFLSAKSVIDDYDDRDDSEDYVLDDEYEPIF